jgi:Holliday junction resolvase RusA-like endonuclease
MTKSEAEQFARRCLFICNTIKGIEYVLKMLIWRDESQVADLVVGKWYSDNLRAEVEIDEIPA